MAAECHAQSACESPAKRLGRAFIQCMRSGGRVVEGARLESEYTAKPYRGFESLPLRQSSPDAFQASRNFSATPFMQ